MSQLPQVSQPVRESLLARGINPSTIYETNRLPNWVIPGTTQCIYES